MNQEGRQDKGRVKSFQDVLLDAIANDGAVQDVLHSAVINDDLIDNNSEEMAFHVICRHQEDIARARRLVSVLLSWLEVVITCPDQQSEGLTFLWGEKESAVTILNRLSLLLLKLVSAEESAIATIRKQQKESSLLENSAPLPQDDIDILEQYIARYLNAQKQEQSKEDSKTNPSSTETMSGS